MLWERASHTLKMARFSLIDQIEKAEKGDSNQEESRPSSEENVKVGLCGKVVVAYMTVVVSVLAIPFLVVAVACLLVLALALIMVTVAALLLSCCCLPCNCCLPETKSGRSGRVSLNCPLIGNITLDLSSITPYMRWIISCRKKDKDTEKPKASTVHKKGRVFIVYNV